MEVTLAEMRGLVRDPGVMIVDVLSPEAYMTAHLPGAINIPAGALRDRATAELPDRNVPIVVYCASPT